MNTRSPIRLVVTTTAAAVMLLPGAAFGAVLSVVDPRGDMVRVDEGGSNPRPAPRAEVGDVLRSTFRHTDRRVVVRVKYADLARTGKRLTLWVDLRDEGGRLRILGVEATRRDRGGHTLLMTGRGRDIACPVRTASATSAT